MQAGQIASADQALQMLAAAPDLTGAGVKLVVIVPDSQQGFAGYKIPLTSEAQADVAAIARGVRGRLQEATLIQYGPAVLVPPQHWMHVSQSEAAVLSQVEQIVGQTDLEGFSGKGTSVGAVRLIAARITCADGTVMTFYRVADTMLQLKKSKALALFASDGVYSKLEAADLLLLQPDFDVVVIGGFAFFAKKPTFERAFGFIEELKKESLATFKAVTSTLNIKGIDELEAACTSQPQMMAKMSSIKRSMDDDSSYATAMTMEKLLKYIDEHPQVDIEVVEENGDKLLVFDPSPRRRFQIVKLLDDDFLHSVLTARDYEAGSKTQTATP